MMNDISDPVRNVVPEDQQGAKTIEDVAIITTNSRFQKTLVWFGTCLDRVSCSQPLPNPTLSFAHTHVLMQYLAILFTHSW
jgi:hypothetical protein